MNAYSHHIDDRGTGDRVCIIIPTYNNEATIVDIVKRTLPYSKDIIVVNDGCTDHTESLLSALGNSVNITGYKKNRGKGYAIKYGFRKALSMGYDYAITIDSDGQHYPEDIPIMMKAFKENRNALIVGCRRFDNKNMPGKNSFANRFSNFWFFVQTGQALRDTQCGYRLYPIRRMRGISLITSRYEAELELLVLAAWQRITLVPVEVRVYYPPVEQRITHFRPCADFIRISILNTILCFLAVFYWISKIFERRKTA